MMSDLSHLYLTHYQRGNGMPVFRGAEYQYGNGLGDILRAVGRFLLPIATGAAAHFISNTASGISQGKSLKDSAKLSIAPTLHNAVSTLGSSINSKLQSGSGRKRRKPKHKSYRRNVKRSAIVTRTKRVYKRRKTRKNISTNKKIKFNF